MCSVFKIHRASCRQSAIMPTNTSASREELYQKLAAAKAGFAKAKLAQTSTQLYGDPAATPAAGFASMSSARDSSDDRAYHAAVQASLQEAVCGAAVHREHISKTRGVPERSTHKDILGRALHESRTSGQPDGFRESPAVYVPLRTTQQETRTTQHRVSFENNTPPHVLPPPTHPPPSQFSVRNEEHTDAQTQLAMSESNLLQVQLELNEVKEKLRDAEQAKSVLGAAMEEMTAVNAVEVQAKTNLGAELEEVKAELQQHKAELDAWQQKCAVYEQTILEHEETIQLQANQVDAHKKLAATAETYAAQMETVSASMQTSLHKDVVKEKQTSSHMASKLAAVVALVSTILGAMTVATTQTNQGASCDQGTSPNPACHVQKQNSANTFWNSSQSSGEIDPEESVRYGPRSATSSHTVESSSPGEACFATPEQLQAIRESLEGLKTELLETMDCSASQNWDRTLELEHEVSYMHNIMKLDTTRLDELTTQGSGMDDQIKDLHRLLSEKNQDLQTLQLQVAKLEKSTIDSLREANAYANADAEAGAQEVPTGYGSDEFLSASSDDATPEEPETGAAGGAISPMEERLLQVAEKAGATASSVAPEVDTSLAAYLVPAADVNVNSNSQPNDFASVASDWPVPRGSGMGNW